MQGGGGSSAHVNCASFAQAGHGSHPGNGNALPAAQPAQFASELWVSVLRQKYPQDPACLQGFFQLLNPHHFRVRGQLPRRGLFRGICCIHHVHTESHYTRISEKVNKFYQDFFRLTPVVFPIFGRLYLPAGKIYPLLGRAFNPPFPKAARPPGKSRRPTFAGGVKLHGRFLGRALHRSSGGGVLKIPISH